jgi:hypothetical protein
MKLPDLPAIRPQPLVSRLPAAITAKDERIAVLQGPSIGFVATGSPPLRSGSAEQREALTWAHGPWR